MSISTTNFPYAYTLSTLLYPIIHIFHLSCNPATIPLPHPLLIPPTSFLCYYNPSTTPSHMRSHGSVVFWSVYPPELDCTTISDLECTSAAYPFLFFPSYPYNFLAPHCSSSLSPTYLYSNFLPQTTLLLVHQSNPMMQIQLIPP